MACARPAADPLVATGLLFAVLAAAQRLGLPLVFALTGFMAYTLGPVLTHTLALPGASTIATALAATGATFLALSAYVLVSRRDFSFMGGFLFAGMVVALALGLAAYFPRAARPGAGGIRPGGAAVGRPDPVRDQPHRAGRRDQLPAGHRQPLRVGLQPVHQPAQPAGNGRP